MYDDFTLYFAKNLFWTLLPESHLTRLVQSIKSHISGIISLINYETRGLFNSESPAI